MVFHFWYFDSPVNRPRFQYRPPNFSAPPLSGAPEARFTPAPADGVLPDGFFSTTNLPTYVKLPPPTGWRRPRLPRMDCVIVQAGPDDLVVSEPRRVRRGDNVAVGAAEDGSEGIFVHVEGFLGGTHSPNEFRFMAAEVSRERPVDYGVLAQLLGEEKERGGKMLWVIGPALVHARAREDMIWFIENGYVSVLFGGNAVAVHDLEAAIFGTTLGMSSSGESVEGGHGLHMRAINAIRRAGSIEKAVGQGIAKSGIMHALVTHRIPYVLAGSIRDDGPLPDVIPDTLAAQDAMRSYTAVATFAVFVATALHAIAVGNMLPAFVDSRVTEDIRPLTTICVDQTEFVVTKLRDRGTHQAYGVVTNAQDFMHVLRFYVERWQQANQTVRTPAPSSR
jgi:lysine-ketoglutarate reductase/saccharopine dehydrogenase-like protein (TIGR00300 family)